MKIFSPSLDSLLLLDDGNTYTSSDIGQVGSADAYIDLGTNWKQRGFIGGYIKVGALYFLADETYTVALQFSNTTNFAAITGQATFVLEPDDSETDPHVSGRDYTVVSQCVGRYARLYYTLGGYLPSMAVTTGRLINIEG